MGERRFPAPWRVEATPSGFRIIDANGQAVAYTYGIRPDEQRTDTGGKLTIDEARRIAAGIARLPDVMAKRE